MNLSKVFFLCIDGCSPEYLKKAKTPNLDKIKSQGFYLESEALIPTVTNLNNVSIVTGVYPEKHGIIGNFYLDPQTRKGVYLESSQKILVPTIFEKLSKRGGNAALFTTKAKLANLLKKGATFVCSEEKPPGWLARKLGYPPTVYSIEATAWLLKAVEVVVSEREFDFVYISTSDFAMHKYAPEDEESKIHIGMVDTFVGWLVKSYPDVNLFITADHGMNEKTEAIDVEELLKQAGIRSAVIPIIKDRYTPHHQNMGGAVYIYLHKENITEKAIKTLVKIKGIEGVYTRSESVDKFHLYKERIGDLFLLADKKTVFGKLGVVRKEVNFRSHGSRYEQQIPIIGWGELAKREGIRENKDIAENILNILTNG